MSLEKRPFKVIVGAGSARRIDGCPGLDFPRAHASHDRANAGGLAGRSRRHFKRTWQAENPGLQWLRRLSMALCISYGLAIVTAAQRHAARSHVGLESVSTPRPGLVVRSKHQP